MMDSMRRVKFQMQKKLRNSGKEFGEKKKNIIKCRMVHEIQRRSPGKGETG